jgi:tetratricopeptide (TPR) repeat protein
LGNLLQNHLRRYEEAETAYRRAIELDPKFASPWNGLGNLWCDHLQRLAEAEVAYQTAEELDPTIVEISLHNRLFLRRDCLGQVTDARPLLEQLAARQNLKRLDALHLQQALFAAYDANWGEARRELSAALDQNAHGFPPFTVDDWIRAAAVLLHLDYSRQLLEMLEGRGDDQRLRPWYEAIQAHAVGDRHRLLNVAVEVRPTAEWFYDEIAKRLDALPESTQRRKMPKQSKPTPRKLGRRKAR